LRNVSNVLLSTWAAFECLLLACGFLADQLTFGFRAKCGLLALPITLRLLTHRSAHWLRGDTSCVALSGGAHCLTLWTVILLAHILRATNVALGLLAVYSALSARSLLALHLTFGSLTNRVTLSRAHGIVALPSTFRMTRSLIC